MSRHRSTAETDFTMRVQLKALLAADRQPPAQQYQVLLQPRGQSGYCTGISATSPLRAVVAAYGHWRGEAPPELLNQLHTELHAVPHARVIALLLDGDTLVRLRSQ